MGGGVGAPAVEQGGHVGGERGGEEHFLTGAGVDEAEGAGVERLAGADFEAVVDELFIGAGGVAAENLVAAVAGVGEERMADVAHVGADLVGAAGLEDAFHQRHVGEGFEDLIVGDGVFPLVGIGRENGHLEAILGVAADVPLDSADGGVGDAPYQRAVFALGGFVEELTAEVSLGVGGLGHDEEPGGVLVDAVHQAEARVVDVVVGIVAQVPGQGVDKGAGPVAVTGVHDQSGRLVDHQYILVLINDVEGDILGENLVGIARTVHHHLHHVGGLDAVVRLHRPAVDQDAAGFGGLLDAVARRLLQVVDEEFVDSQQLLPGVGHEAEMLVHAVFVGYGTGGGIAGREVVEFVEIFVKLGHGS